MRCKVVLSLSWSLIWIFHYPVLASNVENRRFCLASPCTPPFVGFARRAWWSRRFAWCSRCRSVVIRPSPVKYDWLWALWLYRPYIVHGEHFVHFHLLKFVCFRSSAVRSRVNEVYVRCGQLNEVLSPCQSGQVSISHSLKSCKRVQNFLTVIWMRCSNVDTGRPVCIQLIVIDGLDFFAFLHLVTLLLHSVLVYGLEAVHKGFIFLLLSRFGCSDLR